ncbi:MAG: trimethylamine methyltransferase family protein, partial [Bacillota bacterium]|nr:trimethylamine methyltransferase family protein [Bacillota bacterium]
YVATEAECEIIINGAFQILEEVGIHINSEEACDILSGAGCTVDENRIVKIPRELVKKAIESAPSHIQIYNRNGEPAMDLGGTNVYFGNGPTNPFYNDFETNERREARKSDVTLTARLSDALPNIDFVMSLAGIRDWNPLIADVCEMHEMLQNTTKPIVCWGVDVEGLEEQFEMLAAVRGGWDKFLEKPMAICYAGDPVTPLNIPEDAARKHIYCAKRGMTVLWPSGMQPGAVSPITLAGSQALGIAENLAGLVLTQTINPGCGYMAASVMLSFDMWTNQAAYGTPEHCLGESMTADIYHYLGLPLWSTGCATDSKIVDEQAAMEAAFTALNDVLSGANLVHDVGFMDSAMTSHLDMVTLADEAIGYARRVGRGVEITEENLLLDVIKEVGPCGEFITHPSTFEHFKQEYWFPNLLSHERFDVWKENPTDMRTRIHERTKKLLAEHKVPELSADVVAQLDATLAKAKTRIGE